MSTGQYNRKYIFIEKPDCEAVRFFFVQILKQETGAKKQDKREERRDGMLGIRDAEHPTSLDPETSLPAGQAGSG